MNLAYQKTLRRDTADLIALAPVVKEFLERHGAARPAIFKVQLALEEMILNLINHGTGSATGRIDVGVEVGPERIVVVIEDDGDPFDIRSAPEFDTSRPLDERRAGGMGIQLMRGMMDEIHYERVQSRNRLRLVINTSC
jgi:anti-sigma regulatory factor (Ser/Thr protein kinase)